MGRIFIAIIMLSTASICISGTPVLLKKLKVQYHEKKLIKYIISGNHRKASLLLAKNPELANIKPKSGLLLPHYAALSIKVELLMLTEKIGWSFLQTNREDNLPIELVGQAFMQKKMQNCSHFCRCTAKELSATARESIIRSIQSDFIAKECPKKKLQKDFVDCMNFFVQRQEKITKQEKHEYYQKILESEPFSEFNLPLDIEKLILQMTPTRESSLCDLWEKDPRSFLESCPLPPLYLSLHASIPPRLWYDKLLQ